MTATFLELQQRADKLGLTLVATDDGFAFEQMPKVEFDDLAVVEMVLAETERGAQHV